MACLPADSPSQRRLFRSYFQAFKSEIPQLPALLPEVWLHWDPKTVQERGVDALTADRDLKLAGYEAFRFGTDELQSDKLPQVNEFFDRLFDRFKVRSPA